MWNVILKQCYYVNDRQFFVNEVVPSALLILITDLILTESHVLNLWFSQTPQNNPILSLIIHILTEFKTTLISQYSLYFLFFFFKILSHIKFFIISQSKQAHLITSMKDKVLCSRFTYKWTKKSSSKIHIRGKLAQGNLLILEEAQFLCM